MGLQVANAVQELRSRAVQDLSPLRYLKAAKDMPHRPLLAMGELLMS